MEILEFRSGKRGKGAMSQELWTAVDTYIKESMVPADPILTAALQAAVDAGLPAIAVSPTQGKLLHLMARMCGARKILEIGTLGGYSTIWLARALPAGGRIITLELDPKHAEVARKNFAAAGVAAAVEVRVGNALDSLPEAGGRRPRAVRPDFHRCAIRRIFRRTWSGR